MNHHSSNQRSRIRSRSDVKSQQHTPRGATISRTSLFVCLLLAIFSTTSTVTSFQPQHHATTSGKITKGFRPVTKDLATSNIDSSTLKRSNRNCYALDYRDLSSKKKKGSSSRLSLSSIALPSGNSYVNDGSDYYSWLTSGWSGSTAAVTSPEKANAYIPSKQLAQLQQPSTTSILSQSEEYQRRKEEWAKRYTSLKGLRKAFGSNRNKLWGDLDPATTRKLYKSLLPNALCELVLELGVEPEELAPLAYKARKAAKLYARERCHVPERIAANLYDGFRQWRRYGKFEPAGMSWEQLWDKYYHEQLEEVTSSSSSLSSSLHHDDMDHNQQQHYQELSSMEDSLSLDDSVTESEIVAQTCQKILEKACTTNEMIDHMVLGREKQQQHVVADNRDDDHHHDDVRKHRNDLLLKRISRTLTRDFRKLLDPLNDADEEVEESASSKRARPMTAQEYHALKLFALSRRQMEQEAAAAAAGRRSRQLAASR